MSKSSWDVNKVAPQKGKIAVVTGANTGLGYETALSLASKEMKVILACRNLKKAEQAKAHILRKISNAIVECRQIDLSKLSSVRTFAKKFLKDHKQLDLLINNAGIMIPPFSLTEDGFESQMGANYFGHFLLTQLLLKTLMNTANSRIVSLSSLAHKRGKINFDDLHFENNYSAFGAYAQSKLACLIFAIELQRRLEKAGSQTMSLAAHPGISDTELSRFMPKWGILLIPVFGPLISHKPDKGALPTLRAALDSEAMGGEYFGPNHRREYKGPPVKVKARRKAHDVELAQRLWSVSEELTGCKYEFNS